VFLPCHDEFSVGKRVLCNDARYRSRAYRAGGALFRLGTNRLLKISGRDLSEERTVEERKREREGRDGEKDHTLQRVLQCSFTFARIIVFDDSIPFFAWKAHEQVNPLANTNYGDFLRKNICFGFRAWYSYSLPAPRDERGI